MKETVKKGWKKVSGIVIAAMALCVSAVQAGAVDATMESVTTSLSTGFTSIATQAMNVIAIIVPIALGIVAAIFVIKRALSWFKSLAKG